MQTFLEIPVGQQKLAACLHRPAPGRSMTAAPVVLCCHGLTGTRIGSCYRFVEIARRLAQQNMACLRFDFRGCGESEGRFIDVRAATLLEDLHAAIAAVDHLPGCDPMRLGIAASSFGAFTTSLAASDIIALKCLSFIAPVADPRALINRDMNQNAWSFLREHGWVEHFGLRLGAGFIDTLPQATGPEVLAKSPRPLLIFHGNGDRHVPAEQGRAYEAAVRAANVEVRFDSIEADDHGMRSVPANDKIIGDTVAWMRRFLHPEPASTTS